MHYDNRDFENRSINMNNCGNCVYLEKEKPGHFAGLCGFDIDCSVIPVWVNNVGSRHMGVDDGARCRKNGLQRG